jgi:hypothetical protein
MHQLTNPRELRGLAILSQLDTIIQTEKKAVGCPISKQR